MNPTLPFWFSLFGRLAAEAALLVALAAAAQRFVTAPRLRRTLWQSVLLGVALAWAAELGGLRQYAANWWPQPRAERRLVAKIVSAPTNDTSAANIFAEQSETLARTVAVKPARPVWWPLGLWVVGFAAIMLRAVGLRLWLGLATLRRTHRAEAALLARVEHLRHRVGLRRVRVRVWPGLPSPIAFGTLRPTVALPADFADRFSPEAQDAMLAHELAHLAAGDPCWLAVADAVQALAWWHPVVWWARRQLRAAGETAADEASALVPGGRVALAESLVTFGRELASPRWARGLGVAGDGLKSPLARRVKALLRASGEWRAVRPARLWLARGAALLTTVLLVALPWPGTGGPAFADVIVAARRPETKPETTGINPASPRAEERSLGGNLSRPPGWPKSFDSPSRVTYELPRGESWGFLAATPGRVKSEATTEAELVVPVHSVYVALRADESLPAPRSATNPAALFARQFRLPAVEFIECLKRFTPTGNTNLQAALRAFCATNGVEIPSPEMAVSFASPHFGKAVFVNDRTGILYLHATSDDLDRIERAIQRLNLPSASGTADGRAGVAAELRAKDVELVGLRARYKDRHPKVMVALDARADLQAKLQELRPDTTTTATASLTVASPSPSRQIELQIHFAEVTERGSDDLGLDWLFGQSPTNNPTLQSGPATELLTGPGSPHGPNLSVDLLRTEGQSAALTAVQFAALRSRLEGRGGVDFLAAPKVITTSGRQARVEVSDVRTIVSGAAAMPGTATNQAGPNYQTEQISTGPAVDITPVLEGEIARLGIMASVTDFLGYDQPKSGGGKQVTAPGHTPVKGTVPLPRLRVRSAQANALARPGETVALRGPLVSDPVRTLDKVVGLGDVPLLGRLFRTESTNTLRKRLYVFVTPVEITAAGGKQ